MKCGVVHRYLLVPYGTVWYRTVSKVIRSPIVQKIPRIIPAGVWYPYGTVTPYITATNQMPADRQPNSRGVALPHLVSLGESSCSPPGQFFL